MPNKGPNGVMSQAFNGHSPSPTDGKEFRPDPTPFQRAILKQMQRQEKNTPPSLRTKNGHMVATTIVYREDDEGK